MLFFFFSSRNEDRKTVLLKVLSVKELLGFPACGKRSESLCRTSAKLLESETLPTLSWVSSILIKDAGVAVATFQLQRRKQVVYRKRKHKTAVKCHLFCLWPLKRLRLVWKWVSRPAALSKMRAMERNVYFCIYFAKVGWFGSRN